MAKKKTPGLKSTSGFPKLPTGLYIICTIEIIILLIHLLDAWIYNPSYLLGFTLRGQWSQLYIFGLIATQAAFLYAVLNHLKWGWKLYLYYMSGMIAINILNQAISVGNRVVADQVLNFLFTGMIVCFQAIMLGYIYSIRKFFNR